MSSFVPFQRYNNYHYRHENNKQHQRRFGVKIRSFPRLFILVRSSLLLSLSLVLTQLLVYNDSNTNAEASINRIKNSNNINSNNDNLPFQVTENKLLLVKDNQIRKKLQQAQSINSNNNNNIAIIHIGPHKTATTSIQVWTKVLREQLLIDHYQLPWSMVDGVNLTSVKNTDLLLDINLYNLVSCLQDRKELWPEAKCNPKLIDATKQISSSVNNNNIIVSAEEFSRTNIVNIKSVYNLFVPNYKNIRIIAYYRRFYDWIYSYYQQFEHYKPYDKRKSFVEYISNINTIQMLYDTTYVIGCANEYSKVFGSNSVYIYNMHDLISKNYYDVSEQFFCEAIPNATTTCQTVQKRNSINNANQNKKVFNVGHPLVYEELVYVAQKMQLWDNETITIDGQHPNRRRTTSTMLSMSDVTKLVQEYQEDILNLTQYDFYEYDNAVICPNNTILDWLLQISLQTEQQLFPIYHEQIGKQYIMNEFNIWKKTKLCSINVTKVLLYNNDEKKKNIWRNFFQSLGGVSTIRNGT